jgi:hypothetical protein
MHTVEEQRTHTNESVVHSIIIPSDSSIPTNAIFA